jgi:putative tricarboxylic transport membrane protein
MLLILNLPLLGIWVRLLKIPYRILFPIILFLCLIGAYSINKNHYEVIIMIIFGVMGYLMKKFKFEGAPLIMTFVLSPLLENAFRQSLLMSHGSLFIFFSRPISRILFIGAILFLAASFIPKLKRPSASAAIDDS